MQSIKSTETQIKKIIKLTSKLQKNSQNFVSSYIWEKKYLKTLKEISESFGLKFDIKFDVIIVSAEKKYLFNYLSWAFGNKDLKKGAENLSEFIYDKRFTNLIKFISGRAFYDQNNVNKVLCSLNELEKIGYSTKKWSFVWKMKLFCNDINKKLKAGKWIIFIWISKKEKLEHFDRLLAHEIFHLVLMSNWIWFQWIKEEYDNLDEGLVNFLVHRYAKNKNQIATLFWEDKLIPLKKQNRIKEINKFYNDLKKRLILT